MTLRNAPRVGQDGGSCRSDLPDERSGIFLQMGLDSQLTDLPVGQIKLFPLGNFSSIVIPGYARYARLQDLTSVQGATCPPLMAARK